MELDKRWLALVVFILLLAFAVGVKYADFKNDRQAEEEALLQSSGQMDEAGSDELQSKIIQIYVTGAVKNPGVYRLQEGDRVHQAVEMAEALAEADLKHLEMARPLVDGETIPVPAQGEIPELPVPASAGGSYSSGASNQNSAMVNINTASAQEMADQLDGIGPALGQRIVDYRTSNGPFKDIEEIKNVSGIGDKRFEAIKNKISVR
ncbi:MAG: helix-hairpin-helix domain-containing protein [Syntrophomonadaceae bacterium]|nr:helix-hairpin-helix domain-containing protein [Syntrophomonadaceae bacterium]